MKPAKPFSSFICTAIVFISLPTLAFAGDWGNSGSSWGNSNQNNNPQNTTPVGKLMEEIRQIEANIDKEKTTIQNTQAEIEQLNNELNQLRTDSTYIQALQQENTDLRTLRDQLVVEYHMQAKNSPEQATTKSETTKVSSNGTTQQTIETVATEEKTTITLTPNTSGVHFEASAGAVIPFVPYAKAYKYSDTNYKSVSYRSIAAAGMINLGVRLKYVNFLIEQHFGKTYYIGDEYNSFFNGGDNPSQNSGSYFASYLTVGGIIPTSPNFDLRISAGFGAIYGSSATLPEVSSKAVFSFKTGIGGDYIWDNGIKFGFDISYAMAYFTKTADKKGQKLLNYIVPALYIGYIY